MVSTERVYPLRVMVCTECLLVQLDQSVPPEYVFSNYAYFSSYSTSWLAHCKAYVEMMCARFGLGPSSNVLEIASNDGYLLQYFLARKVPAIGVEPAQNVASVAISKGIPTKIAFFNEVFARTWAAEGYQADVIVSNNVLAHVPDTNNFVAGIPHVLQSEGVWTIEFPHLLELLNGVQFDTIYHEHYSYFSVLALERILARHKLRAFDIERLPTHGGSLRVFVCHEASKREACAGLHEVRVLEHAARIDELTTYDQLQSDASKAKEDFLTFVAQARQNGQEIVGYGAAAKGNTFLNYCGISPKDITYVVDMNPVKQGTLLPGTHLPVLHPDEVAKTKPDYLLIIPWNLREEISTQLQYIRSWGGRFVRAIPILEVF